MLRLDSIRSRAARLMFIGFAAAMIAGAIPGSLFAQSKTAGTGMANGGQVSETVLAHGVGVSSYRASDPARSRTEALQAAQRDAVEKASGVMLSSQSVLRNFELVKDEVLSRSVGYVKTFDLTVDKRDGGTYRVELDAEVVRKAFLEDMANSLEALYQRVGKPRVIVVVRNTPGQDPQSAGSPPNQLLVKEIQKILIKRGFTFIDSRSLDLDLESESISLKSVLDSTRAQPRGAGAEILILGEVSVVNQGVSNSFHMVQAVVNIDVVRVSSGQIMASETKSVRGLHPVYSTAVVRALGNSAENIVPSLMEQISYQWIKSQNEGSRIELVVKNASFMNLVALRKALKNEATGIRQIQQRSYRQGTGTLEVETFQDTGSLAETLYEMDFGRFRLEITNVEETRLTVEVIK